MGGSTSGREKGIENKSHWPKLQDGAARPSSGVARPSSGPASRSSGAVSRNSRNSRASRGSALGESSASNRKPTGVCGCLVFVERVAGHLPTVVAKGGRDGLQHLFEVTVSEVAAQGALYRVLLREIPFVPTLPGVLRLQERAFTYARAASAAAQPAIRLPDFERDTWLIWQMTYNTLLEIGFGQHAEAERGALVDALVRLVARMLYPGNAEAPPG